MTPKKRISAHKRSVTSAGVGSVTNANGSDAPDGSVMAYDELARSALSMSWPLFTTLANVKMVMYSCPLTALLVNCTTSVNRRSSRH